MTTDTSVRIIRTKRPLGDFTPRDASIVVEFSVHISKINTTICRAFLALVVPGMVFYFMSCSSFHVCLIEVTISPRWFLLFSSERLQGSCRIVAVARKLLRGQCAVLVDFWLQFSVQKAPAGESLISRSGAWSQSLGTGAFRIGPPPRNACPRKSRTSKTAAAQGS